MPLYVLFIVPPPLAHTCTAQADHYRRLKAVADEVDTTCGGLIHLELAENKVTNWGKEVTN